MTDGIVVVWREQEPPRQWKRSLFLTGPGDAEPGVQSWKHEALALLKQRGFDGVVFVDDDANVPGAPRSEAARRWASYWRRRSDLVVCWFPPRAQGPTLELVRLGRWSNSGRYVVGVADDAVADYSELRRWAVARSVPVETTLKDTVRLALRTLPPGALRRDGEREIPLLIWNTQWFQGWLRAQRTARNRLLGLAGSWTFRTGPGKRHVVFWGILPILRLVSERRTLVGEFVIGRPDISAVVHYRRRDDGEYEVVLVRDARPAARTPDAHVWEFPGGSGDSSDPRVTATMEYADETGLGLDSATLRDHGELQIWPTAAAHNVRLFSAEATASHMDAIRRTRGPRGLHSEQEYTWPIVLTVSELYEAPVGLDVLGMLTKVFHDLGIPH